MSAAVNGVIEDLNDNNGDSYPVTFTYLANGQVQAKFTYTYPNKNSWTDGSNTSFPIAAQGTRQYIISYPFTGDPALILADGSTQTLVAANDCNGFYGTAGCIESDPDFVALLAAIKAAAPANVNVTATTTATNTPSAPQPATISAAQLQTEITSALQSGESLSAILTIATQAGYLVYESADGQTAIVRDPVTFAVVAAIGAPTGDE